MRLWLCKEAITPKGGIALIVNKYLRPATLGECVEALAELGDEAVLLAGGTDLIPKMRQGKLSVQAVIDLSRIPELSRIEEGETGVTIGSMCRLRRLAKDAPFSGPLSVISQCAGHVSSMQVRNIATLGGNICNASPAADTVPGLLLLDAAALIFGKDGTREVPLVDFFTGPGETVMGPCEVLTGVFVSYAPDNTGAAYLKYAIRGDTDISIVGAGARLTLDADGRISDARIALAAAGPTPLRMMREEQMLTGMMPDDALFGEVAASCAESCCPVTDHRASESYRRDMVRLWVESALHGAVLRV